MSIAACRAMGSSGEDPLPATLLDLSRGEAHSQVRPSSGEALSPAKLLGQTNGADPSPAVAIRSSSGEARLQVTSRIGGHLHRDRYTLFAFL